MCYTMLNMLKWMWKGKYRIGTLRTRGKRGSALLAYVYRKKSLGVTSLLCKSVVQKPLLQWIISIYR